MTVLVFARHLCSLMVYFSGLSVITLKQDMVLCVNNILFDEQYNIIHTLVDLSSVNIGVPIVTNDVCLQHAACNVVHKVQLNIVDRCSTAIAFPTECS